MKRSQAVLGGLLAVSVAAALWLAAQPEEDAVTALPARRAAPPAARVQASTALQDPLPSDAPRDPAAWGPLAPPAALAWGVAPLLPPAAPTPPAPPAPPPLPYTLIGRIDDGGVARAYLAGPRMTVAVKAGDALDGPWRVVAVDDDGVEIAWTAGDGRQRLNYRQP